MKLTIVHCARTALLSAAAALPTFPALADVVLVPGTIEGSIQLGTETIRYVQVRAQNSDGSAYQYLSPNVSSAPYELTVNVPSGGSADYSVRAENVQSRDSLVSPYDFDYFSFPAQTVSVDENTPTQADFVLSTANYARGTVTLNGSGSLSLLQIYATPVVPNGFGHYTAQHTNSATANSRDYEFPISGGDMRCTGQAYLSTGGRIDLPEQIASPVNGIVTCDWDIDTPEVGTIEGSIEMVGDGVPNRFFMILSGTASRSWNKNSPTNPDYFSFDDLPVGTSGLNAFAYLNNNDDYYRFPYAAYDPNYYTLVEAGDVDVIDISACQAYINGTVELIGAAQWSDVNSSEFNVSGVYDSSLPDGGPTRSGSSRDRIDLSNGDFDVVVSPGPWNASSLYIRFYDPDPADYRNSWVNVYDRSVMYNASRAELASCGDEELRDYQYNMGQVTVNFAVDGSEVLSYPRLYGSCYEYDDANQQIYGYYFDARNESQVNVSDGSVTFTTPQGHCPSLRAEASVAGSQTTFGELELDVIGGGEVIIDIGGPGVTLVEPEANLCLDAAETTVSGTATDDIGVASVTVNGVDAILAPAGGEGTLSTDFSATISLTPGANVVETIATDTSGKTGSDNRMIYRDGGPPLLEWLPLSGATTAELSIDVEGVVSDDIGIDSVTVNGSTVALSASGTPGEYTFSAPVALSLGSNMITVAVTEETGCAEVVEVREVIVVENQPPVADAGGPYSVDEGSSIALDGSLSSDPDDDPLSYEWDFDYDGGSFDVDSSGSASPTFPAATLDGPSVVTVALRVTDTEGETDIALAEVTVNNVAPELGEISVIGELVPIGTEVFAGADFTDPGLADTHTATWNWGDSTSAGTVTDNNGSGSVSDSHTYSEPGVYTIELTLQDDDGGSDSMRYQYVVVYDPDGSFVTGGGTIDSPAGAYLAEPELTGVANFGFVSKYKKGANEPTGHTEFQFHAAGMDFKSTDYQWLVVAGARAQFKGSGTIQNATGSFGFMLTAIDGAVNGGGGADKFRIKIWDASDDSIVVYDNQLGSADDADPTTALRSGSIVIHSKGNK